VPQGAVTTDFRPRRTLLWRRKADAESGDVPRIGHRRYVFNRWKVPSDNDCTSPNVSRQPFVPGNFDQEAASPKQGKGSFIWHRHLRFLLAAYVQQHRQE
jgi:hypothetical protein